MSVVYTSHYMEEVELLCKRVAIIDQGKIIAMDTIKNLISMLGGGVVYIGLASVDEDILAGLAALPAVKEVDLVPPPITPPAAAGSTSVGEVKPPAASPLIKIVAENNQTALVNVIDYLNRRDITLTSLEILQPNLESVFLHLTGKKLRE
jgi:ABC-2 type transport system ATP-binding protein